MTQSPASSLVSCGCSMMTGLCPLECFLSFRPSFSFSFDRFCFSDALSSSKQGPSLFLHDPAPWPEWIGAEEVLDQDWSTTSCPGVLRLEPSKSDPLSWWEPRAVRSGTGQRPCVLLCGRRTLCKTDSEGEREEQRDGGRATAADPAPGCSCPGSRGSPWLSSGLSLNP